MSSLFGDVDAKNVEEYVPKVHYMVNDGTVVLCNTKNTSVGTDEEDKVTCKNCLKRLERGEIYKDEPHMTALLVTLTADSPAFTPNNAKKVIMAWFKQIPDNVKLEMDYRSNKMRATWTETRT